MPCSVSAKRARFRQLHESGCFILPNPWDVGSAKMLEHLGFAALASTSSGRAWAAGMPDYAVEVTEVIQHLTMLVKSVAVPINADFENGFATTPEGVAENVLQAIGTGVAGLSIEDFNPIASELYSEEEALERLSAARLAIDGAEEDVILVARTEGLLIDPEALTPAIDRLVAFAAAGADCLYAPGVRDKVAIATMVRAVSPKPLNLLVKDPNLSHAEIADLGVRRISVGGSLARVGWASTISAAKNMLGGSFQSLSAGCTSAELNKMFSAPR
jgi:2-methylisocitrate lyase-like PEP mutase family enzyme